MAVSNPKVLFVTLYAPDPNGNGGNHRSYQILHDLQTAFGSENILLLNYNQWHRTTDKLSTSETAANAKRKKNWWTRLRDKVQLRTKLRVYWKEWRNNFRIYTRLKLPALARLKRDEPLYYNKHAVFRVLKHPLEDNVFRSVYPTKFDPNRYSRAEFLLHYRKLLADFEPNVVVIEHSAMQEIIELNHKRHLPTIICPQNLEGLDLTGLREANVWQTHARLYDLASEYMLFERCTRRLFISKVEAGFIQGLGCASEFYPYRAVGEIYERMSNIRQQRGNAHVVRGLFLMIGSAHYPPIGDGLQWLAEQFAKNGLPSGARVVAVGRSTDKLLPANLVPPGLDLRGWTKQDELDNLMLQTQGILVPYRFGFGALTRLSELPHTGIPIIASEFATRGIESLDGIFPVANVWQAWHAAMTRLMNGTLALEELSNDGGKSKPNAIEASIRQLTDQLRFTETESSSE